MIQHHVLQDLLQAQQAELQPASRRPPDPASAPQSKAKWESSAAARVRAAAVEGQQQGAAGPHAAAADKGTASTVFVRGLPLDVTPQQLQAKFQTFGRIKACRCDETHGPCPPVWLAVLLFCCLKCAPAHMSVLTNVVLGFTFRLVMNKATQKPKGTAFVEFHDADSANHAAAASITGRCDLARSCCKSKSHPHSVE